MTPDRQKEWGSFNDEIRKRHLRSFAFKFYSFITALVLLIMGYAANYLLRAADETKKAQVVVKVIKAERTPLCPHTRLVTLRSPDQHLMTFCSSKWKEGDRILALQNPDQPLGWTFYGVVGYDPKPELGLEN